MISGTNAIGVRCRHPPHTTQHHGVPRRSCSSVVAAATIKGFELLGADSNISTLNKLRRALEAPGVEFIDDGAKSDEGGPGVRLRVGKAKR
jgi:hypothetical protein